MATFTHNVIELATLAGCGQPNSPSSPGAEFLIGIVNAVEDAIDNGELDERLAHELAEDAPAVSTDAKWQQFSDLLAWRIDVTDLTGDRISPRALTEHAHTVLVVIATDLIAALIAEHKKSTEGE